MRGAPIVGLSEKEMAEKMIDSLLTCHLGTAINSCHQKILKLTYNIDRVVAANAKAAAAKGHKQAGLPDATRFCIAGIMILCCVNEGCSFAVKRVRYAL